MNEYRAFARGTGLIAIISGLTQFSAFISLPILTKTLSIEEYGIWAIVIISISLIPRIVMFGLPGAMIRFLAAAKTKDDILKGFYTTLFYVSISTLATSVLIFLSAKHLAWVFFNGNATIVKLMAGIILFESMHFVFSAYFRTRQRVRTYSLFTFLKAYLNLSIIAYFVLNGYGIVGAVFGLFISGSIVAAIEFLLIAREIGVSFKYHGEIKKYLRFGMPLIPANLSNWIVNSSDRYLIGLIMGVSFVGYYAPAYALGMIVAALITPLNFMLMPFLSKYYDERNMKAVTETLHYSFKFFIGLSIPAVVGLSLLSRQFLLILSREAIASAGSSIVPLIAASGMAFGLYVILSQPVILLKKTKIMGLLWTGAAGLNLLINLVLIPGLGILGAAIATLIAFSFALGGIGYFSLTLIPFKVDFGFILKVLIASAFMSIPIIEIPTSGLVQTVVISLFAFLIYASLIFVMKGIKKDEVLFFKNLL